MADFFQTGSIPTLHRLGAGDIPTIEEKIQRHTSECPLALVLPCHVDDLKAPSIKPMLREIAALSFFRQIIVGIDGASPAGFDKAKALFSRLPQETWVLWNDGPEMSSLLAELRNAELGAGPAGKGRNMWLCCGLVLALETARSIALHDCDIRTYSRELPARLCYPVVHPTLGFDFCKGYSARFTDRLHGRVMRLLFTPLIRSLKSIFGDEPFLRFLDSFRYPLSGEVCFSIDVARRCRFPSDWGVEIGMLAEVFKTLSPNAICQVECTERYDHKHQELSIKDPTKGLNKMAVDVTKCVFHTLAERGLKLDRGVFDTLRSAYANQADDAMRAYAADADLNCLSYHRHDEELAVATFAGSIRIAADAYLQDPAESRPIPSWNQVGTALPDFPRKLIAAAHRL